MTAYQQPKFSTKVFNTAIFDKYLHDLTELPCELLEIGTFEGQSARYLLEHWRKARVTTIDPCTPYPIPGYEDYIPADLSQTIRNNLAEYIDEGSCIFIQDFSYNVLPTLQGQYIKFSMILIDGDHRSDSVYMDAVMSWPILMNGGILIFDDATWVPKGAKAGTYTEYCPKNGIERFMKEHEDSFDILEKGYVVVLRKKNI